MKSWFIGYCFGKNNYCKCGTEPNLIQHYVGCNHTNYFCKCPNCKTRTRNRKDMKGAISDWVHNIKMS